MSDEQVIWVDVARCTGCGACVEVCPVEAIALVDGRAHVDEETCTGCGACVDVCPEGATQPVVQGELLPAPERSVPTTYRPSPLAETAGTAVVATGVELLAKAAGALAQAVRRWLLQPSTETRARAAKASSSRGPSGAGRGRRARHRRRGR